MLLLLGEPDDALLTALAEEASRRGADVDRLDEAALFSAGIALRLGAGAPEGHILHEERRLALSNVTGVVLRLPLSWWPDDGFSLKDRLFIRHETVAAWIAMIKSGIRAPVVNDFALNWWLSDPLYRPDLRRSLAAALQVADSAPPGSRRTEYWIAGEAVLASSGDPWPCTGPALAAWRAATGMGLARLDCALDGDGRLAALLDLDPFPPAPADGALRAEIAAALLGGMDVGGRA
jgi:hypothetical protein